jgi:hypothetical protein
MQDQRIEDEQHEDRVSPSNRDKAILSVLLCDPAPWSFEEIVCEFDGNKLGVEDALGRLAGCGLIHRLGGFYFPTRATRYGDDINLE